MSDADIYDRKAIDVLAPELKKLIADRYRIAAFAMTGVTTERGFGDRGAFPECDMQRRLVFKASTGDGSYNHNPMLAEWKGVYWCAWHSCLADEAGLGQRVLIARSDDGREWTGPSLVADGDAKGGMLRLLSGLCPCRDKLYAVIKKEWDPARATNPGMSAHNPTKPSYTNDLWVSSDGVNWEVARDDHLDVVRVNENPRVTAEGRLMVGATLRGMRPGVLLWLGDDPADVPDIIAIPYEGAPDNYYAGHDEGLFFYGESSWYTDDRGQIWMWHRDESGACCLGVAMSTDGGRTWTEVIRSDFPDSMSKVFAGRLSDGRFYLVGNATPMYMDRNFFALSLSDDGARFDRMYQLIADRAQQRFQGHLKCHGYQYPSCVVDGDRLLIAYSVNKESIECGIVDLGQM